MTRQSETAIFGLQGEILISEWLRANGYGVTPLYQMVSNNQAPKLLLEHGLELLAPDLYIFREFESAWVEVKRKKNVSYHRRSERWVTGVNPHNFEQYLSLAKIQEFPVILLFLLEKPTDDGAFPASLYGADVRFLERNINHHYDGTDHPQNYWDMATLNVIATIEEVRDKSLIGAGSLLEALTRPLKPNPFFLTKSTSANLARQ